MKRRNAIILSSLIIAALSIFFLYPAGMVVKQAFEGTAEDGSKYFTLEFIQTVFTNPVYREGMLNALWLGLSSTLA
ncbi:MAG: hypothetical protein ACO3RV_05925, partial [Luteolibacter sp.]